MKSSTHAIILVFAMLSCCRLSDAQKKGSWACKDGYWSVIAFNSYLYMLVSIFVM